MIKVVDIDNKEVKAVCAQFKYKGFIVSSSNIFSGDVMAFDLSDNIICSGSTVEEVVKKLDDKIE